MRILIMTGNDIFAGIALYKLMRRFQESIVGVFVLKDYMYKKNSFALFRLIAKKSGLRYALYLAIELISYRLVIVLRKLFRFNKEPDHYLALPTDIARKYHIPLFFTHDILTEQTLLLIHSLHPDLGVSVRFSQIIKNPLLTIPSHGILNLHTSLLPKYGGLGAIFHALFRGETSIGVTVHYMSEKVDEGDIVVQETIPVTRTQSISNIQIQCHRKAADLLARAVESVQKGARGWRGDESKRSYFSWPTKEKVREFKKKGYALMRFSDITSLLFHFSYE